MSTQRDKFFELSQNLWWLLDAEGCVRDVNPAWQRSLGWLPGDVLGRPLGAFIYSGEADLVAAMVKAATTGHGHVEGLCRFIHRYGGYRWMRVQGQADGVLGSFYGEASDVTERRRSQLLTVMKGAAAQIGGWEIDFSTGDIYWDEETYRIHGAGVSFQPDLVNTKAFWPDVSYVALEEGFRRLIATGAPFEGEYAILGPQGKNAWVKLKAQAEAGTPVMRVYGTIQDITARRESEMVIKEALMKYEVLASHVGDVMWMMTKERDRFTFISPSFESVWGQSCEQAYADASVYTQAIHPDDRERMRELARDPTVVYDEVFLITASDGRCKWINERVFPIRDQSGGVMGLVGLARDLTERVENEKELVRTMERYRFFLETSMEGIWEVDAQGTTTFVNKRCCDMLGYRSEEMLGRPFTFFMGEACQAKAWENLERHRQGVAETIPVRLLSRQGHDVWTLMSTKPVWDDMGRMTGAVAMITDITALRQQEDNLKSLVSSLVEKEAALSESRERLRMALDAAGLGVWDWNLVTDRVVWDDRMYELYGVPPSQGYEHPSKLRERVPREKHGQLGMPEELAYAAVSSFHYEFPIQGLDGVMRRIKGLGSIVRDASGQAIRLIGCSWDVSKQSESEEKINTLVALIESSTEFFAYYDVAGTPLYVNACAREQFGWVDAVEMADHYPPEGLRIMREQALPTAATGQTWEHENYLLNRRTGERVAVWQRVFALKGSDGQPKYYASIATDIRQRKAAESTLIQASKMASLGVMASGIAHEVNNPLAVIQGKVQQIRKRLLDETMDLSRLRKDLEMIEGMTKRIVKIIKGLRSFSRRGENDPFTLASLASVVDDTIEICRERFERHDIRLEVEVDEVILACQPVQLSQVLLNLMNNAFDAVVNLPHPWVELVAKDAGDCVRIIVRDAGVGIPEGIREKIMDPFFTTKEVGKGTGLGLSISRGIVENHEGRLWLDARDAHTSFIIELPKDFGFSPQGDGGFELPKA